MHVIRDRLGQPGVRQGSRAQLPRFFSVPSAESDTLSPWGITIRSVTYEARSGPTALERRSHVLLAKPGVAPVCLRLSGPRR